uniref:Uncharacterized protein n=1 Tax=Arundo donax TaxID=35708 RepID=A0A0A8Z1C4_ARUDO
MPFSLALFICYNVASILRVSTIYCVQNSCSTMWITIVELYFCILVVLLSLPLCFVKFVTIYMFSGPQ